LDTSSDYHANLYKHFRDAQQEHFRLSDEEKETLRQIGSEELAVFALLGLRAGLAATGGAGDEDAEEQLEDSESEQGASVYIAYSESEIQSKKCTKHNIVFKNCADPDCIDEYQTIWNAYQQQFNGSKNWSRMFVDRDKVIRVGDVSVLLHRMQELNLDSAW
jgi:hypothetical protein